MGRKLKGALADHFYYKKEYKVVIDGEACVFRRPKNLSEASFLMLLEIYPEVYRAKKQFNRPKITRESLDRVVTR